MSEKPIYPFKWRPLEADPTRMVAYREDGKDDGCGAVALRTLVAYGIAEAIYNMEVRPDDIWIISYPKCGIHWSSEVIWSLTHMGSEDMDSSLLARAPLLESGCMVPPEKREAFLKDPRPFEEKPLQGQVGVDPIRYVTDHLKSPRIMRLHAPLSHLPPDLLDKAKVIYVQRNPKDQIVSFWHQMEMINRRVAENPDEYARKIMSGAEPYDYLKHLKAHWPLKNHANFKIFRYEDMKADFANFLEELQEFTGYKLKSEEEREKLMTRCGMDSMRQLAVKTAFTENSVYQKFFRKGQVGDWTNHLKPDTVELLDKYISDQLEGSGVELYDGGK